MATEAIVLYPTPPIGHLISMVELGKLILTSKPSLSIHILITTPPYNAGDTAPYIAAVAAAVPSITFHRLPAITLPLELQSNFAHHEDLTFEILKLNKPFVAESLASISGSHTVLAFVMDFFCAATLPVAADLGVPPYFFFTSGASCLASFLYLPTLHRSSSKSFAELGDTLLHIPGIPPFPATDMPTPMLQRNTKAYDSFYEGSSVYFPRAAGIITNTFEALEPRVIRAISDGLCIPDGPTPPIHCIGPVISAPKEKDPSSDTCLSWLNSQPSRSVVFLCFGSLGLFSLEQLKEIAVGLERSGQRFLWVVRNPPADKKRSVAVSLSTPPEDPKLEELLPEGFLERTKEKGLVVKNWAPQVAVLRHDSVSGFVTHCGWNSVLESVTAGVPMVAWPLYAEQRINRVMLVQEIGIALGMSESGPDWFVSASEVERRVTELMQSPESGDSVRARALRMKSEARAAVSDGGSSRAALNKLTESSWKPRG